MEEVKLDAREVEAVRELTKYAKELYVKYENFAKNIRTLKELPENYEELKGNSWLLACELYETTQLRVSKTKKLIDRSQLVSRANFIDMMFARLYEITHYASLVEPYVDREIYFDIQKLSYKMREVARTIVK
ncbi:MAG: hypothetical protein HFJ41_00185 [Clostridia bacterium]|nr:hypothetical protein [Clostridia bacterium]